MMYRALYAAFCILGWASAAGAADLPGNARPMKSAEVKVLWVGKTQVWATSGGGRRYYAPDGNVVSYTTAGTFGEGSWKATDDGRFCIDVKWTSKGDWKFGRKGASPDLQCWDHQSADGKVYQRWDRKPDGSRFALTEKSNTWYVWTSDNMFDGDRASESIRQLLADFASEPKPDAKVIGKRLTPAEIKTAIFGRTQTGETVLTGAKFSTKVGVDGIFTSENVQPSGQKGSTVGVSRIDGDRNCYKRNGADIENCYFVARNGENYFFLFPDGTISNTFTVK